MRITEDVIFQIDRSGNWILYNVFTHDTVVAEPALLPVLTTCRILPTSLPLNHLSNVFDFPLTSKSNPG